jgi:hypothetical protein
MTFDDFVADPLAEFGLDEPDSLTGILADPLAGILGDPLATLLRDLPDLPAVPPESIPVHTIEVSDALTMTVIRVTNRGRQSHQLYAVDDQTWALVAIFGLFVDALAEIRRWRRYLAAGGSLREWSAANPDGCRPDQPMITIESAVTV